MFKNKSIFLYILSFIINRCIILFSWINGARLPRCIVILRFDDLGDAAIWCQTAGQIYEHYKSLGLKVIFIGTQPYYILGSSFKFYDKFIQIDVDKFTISNLFHLVSLSMCYKTEFLIVPTFSRFLGQGYRRLSWVIWSQKKLYVEKFIHSNPIARIVQTFLDRLIFNSRIAISEMVSNHELVFNHEVVRSITGHLDVRKKVSCRNKIERVVIFPGCKDRVRRWPTKKYFRTASLLSSRGYDVKVIAVGTELDSDIALEIPKNINFNIELSLNACIQAIKECDCVIGNDSGPIHVARAFEKTAIVIGWGGMFGRFLDYPDKKDLRILRNEKFCEQCNCEHQRNLATCLINIDEQDVLKAIEGISIC